MRLKHYLRGLGIGIIVTVMIGCISSSNQTSVMTDEEIKAKASDLGMVEALYEPTKEPVEEITEDLIEDLIEEPTEEPTEEPIEESTENPIEEEFVDESIQKLFIVEVQRGDSSNTVAFKLEQLHVIDSASLFDEYLCANEYSKKIRIGKYEIPIESTYEQIANIICGIE